MTSFLPASPPGRLREGHVPPTPKSLPARARSPCQPAACAPPLEIGNQNSEDFTQSGPDRRTPTARRQTHLGTQIPTPDRRSLTMRATLAATFMLTTATVRLAHVGIIIPIAVLLVVAGCGLIGQGLYIHAKAVLAQILLERAFAQTLATGQDVKPWSWADTWPVARVEVPRLGKSEIVLAGATGQAIAFGPGHVERTPQAGEPGTAVL